VSDREFVTVYQPKKSRTANYSVRFVLRLADRTPQQADLDDFRTRFLDFVRASALSLAG
jgi:hypothetical protein